MILLLSWLAANVWSFGAESLGESEHSSPPLRVVVFLSGSCRNCTKLKEENLTRLNERYGESVSLEIHDIDDMSQYALLVQYEGHYGSKENVSAKVFAGSGYIAGIDEIREGLDGLIEGQLKSHSPTYHPTGDSGKAPHPSDSGHPSAAPAEEIRMRFMAFGLLTVGFAGLVDGVNPCAFTTLVFFLSLLTWLGRSRGEMLVVGTGFLASMFATYLIIGLGALKALKLALYSNTWSQAFTALTAGLAALLAAWSFRDYLRYRRSGNVHDVSLKLPDALRVLINRVLRSRLGTGGLLGGAVTSGFLVTLLESVCTGQVYLPTIMFVLRDPHLQAHAFFYLFLYNLMFILPLAVIFALGYFGVGSQRLGIFLRAHLGAFKLAMAACFTLLAAMLVLSVLL